MTKNTGLISIGHMARLLMILEERIRQLVKQGFIPRPRNAASFNSRVLCKDISTTSRVMGRRSAKSAADSRVRYAWSLRSSSKRYGELTLSPRHFVLTRQLVLLSGQLGLVPDVIRRSGCGLDAGTPATVN
jgi:hypothetical protein